MADRPARVRTPKSPPPPKPWRRAEAGRYRSSDERFTIESGGGAWFVTDAEALDELGLARTTGPFATLDAAKGAADGARDRPAEASPLAGRIAEAAARPTGDRPGRRAAGLVAARDRKPEPGSTLVPAAAPEATAEPSGEPAPTSAVKPRSAPGRAIEPEPASEPGSAPASEPEPVSEPGSASEPAAAPKPAPPPRTWLDDLEDADRARAVAARRLIAALERDGITDAEALVRRDLLGGTPAVATRLLARAVLASLAGLRNPSGGQVAEAVASVLVSSPKRTGLPGWELLERDGPNGERRGLRLTTDDLRAATEHEPDR